MSSPNDQVSKFFTRKRANEGFESPLSLPDGTPTEHTITIYGVDSDSFRKAQSESHRRMIDIAARQDKEAAEQMVKTEKFTLLASLVKSWTFDMPATVENVAALLEEAPQIADMIDRIASDRKRFFRSGSSNSSPAQEPNSNSVSQ
jgi:hypothetical protein